MTKQKTTKKALLFSVLSMMLCIAMLVGSTFAWFTDSVTSGKNKIVAGNLDVELYAKKDAGEYTAVTEETNLFLEDAFWEPGHVETVNLKVANLGTLALTYQLGINIASEKGSTNVNDEAFKLSDYIKFAVLDGEQTFADRDAAIAAADATAVDLSAIAVNEGGVLYPNGKGEAEKLVTLVVYMPTTVGNEANYKTGYDAPEIELGINLVATQTPYENDSFGSDYDANAEYPPVEVATVNDLKKAFENGGNIKLTSEIAIPDILEIPADAEVVLDLNGKTITSDNSGTVGQNRPIVNYGTLVIKGNGTIDTTDATGYGAIRNYGTLTIEDGTFKGSGIGGGSAVDNQAGGTTTINGGTYYATGAVMNRAGGTMIINSGDFEGVTNANEKYSSGIWSYAIRNYGDMTINDCNMHGSMNGGVACDQGTITINGGYFKVEDPEGSVQSYYVLLTNRRTSSKIIVNGGTVEQTNGTDRLLGGFNGMPSWDATTDLEANGFTINGGTFILNGETVTIP